MAHKIMPVDSAAVPGFLSPEEGAVLYEAARVAVRLGPAVEIGAYCGRSALYIGTACKETGALLFSVDHHRGSEENQPGWEYHDARLWDAEAGALDTLPVFRRTIRRSGLEGTVVAMVGPSAAIGAAWARPLGFLFIDGGHSYEAAIGDYRAWAGHVARGGIMAIHDVFTDPAEGGRPPFLVYQMALQSGLFAEMRSFGSLRLLERL